MIVSSVHIPSFDLLIRVLPAKPSCGKYWQKSYPHHSIQFYPRASFALASAIKNILNERQKDSGIVWIPDYFCNEALEPLRAMNIPFHFYPIKENLEPNWDDIELDIKGAKPPDIFIIVHYFGFPSSIDKAVKLCKKYNIELIEDMAHLLGGTVGADDSFKIFSPRKLLPIPEGGLLLSFGQRAISQDVASTRTRNISILKWILVKFIQNILISTGISWYEFSWRRAENRNKKKYRTEYSVENRIPNNYSMKLLSLIEEKIPVILNKRKSNYEWLYERINKLVNVYPLFSNVSQGACPYVFPLVIYEKKDELYKELRLKGIPASAWPYLPPEVEENKEKHEIAIWLRDHILLLPVHQDLERKQLDYMANILIELCPRDITYD